MSIQPSSDNMTGASGLKLPEDFVDTVNRFGFQLQRLMLSSDKPSGLCAMNIYQSLVMAAVGSKNENLAAFAKVLGFNIAELDQAEKNIMEMDAYIRTSQGVELSIASSVWHKQDFILEKEWSDRVLEAFGATLGPLELEPMNRFIEVETKGKIKHLISESEVANTVLTIITCLYFKAMWETPFEILMTKEESFRMFDNTMKNCSMMHRVGMMHYVEDGKIQICVLPYKASDLISSLPDSDSNASPCWKAAICLPKEPGLSAMEDIISTFSASPSAIRDQLQSYSSQRRPNQAGPSNSGLSAKRVDLALPRFIMKLGLDLMEPLDNLGLTPVFEASSNFNPISRTGMLQINRVTHDMFIEVNEEGTEMAATTIVSFRRSLVPTVNMRVDRPFLFLIFDGMTGLVLCSVVVDSITEQ